MPDQTLPELRRLAENTIAARRETYAQFADADFSGSVGPETILTLLDRLASAEDALRHAVAFLDGTEARAHFAKWEKPDV